MRCCLIFLLGLNFAACQSQYDATQSFAVEGYKDLGFLIGDEAAEKAAGIPETIFVRSTDGGQTWQDIRGDLPANFRVRDLVAQGPEEVLVGSEEAFFRNPAVTTSKVWEKDLLLGRHVDRIYPTTRGFFVSKYDIGLFHNVAGTEFWDDLSKNLPDKTIRCLLEVPATGLFICCDSGIYKSTDGGKSWKQVTGEGSVSDLYVAKDGAITAVSFLGLLHTTDSGDHWYWSEKGDEAHKVVDYLDGNLVALVQQDRTWKTVSLEHLKTGTPEATGNANNWPLFPEGLSEFKWIYQFKQVGETLFCSHDGGLSRSVDRGKTWQLLIPSKKGDILHIEVTGTTIFVATSFGC